MSTAMAPLSEEIERVLLTGDLSKLTPEQRLSYYNRVCESLDLNPLTKPFSYLQLSGKTVLYANKDCTEQLRSKRIVSVRIVAREVVEGCYVVTAQAALPSGRVDESIGAVPIENLKGEMRSNAMMKCETKAKRRVTLSICGLGMLDESEVDSIPGAMLPDQGNKEAQQDVAQRRIKELGAAERIASPRDPDATGTIKPATIIELADSLDISPTVGSAANSASPSFQPSGGGKSEKSATYEKREAAKQNEAAAALKPSLEATAKRRRGAISFTALKAWGEIKKEILALTGTTDLYYEALKAGGYQHADEIKTQEDAAKIWKALKAITAELGRSKQDKALMLEVETHALRIGAMATQAALERRGLSSIEQVLEMQDGTELDILLRELRETV